MCVNKSIFTRIALQFGRLLKEFHEDHTICHFVATFQWKRCYFGLIWPKMHDICAILSEKCEKKKEFCNISRNSRTFWLASNEKCKKNINSQTFYVDLVFAEKDNISQIL